MSKRLGKGLEALLGAAVKPDREAGVISRDLKTQSGLLELGIKQLVPGRYQPRTGMREAELIALSDSIRTQGIIQPVLVRKKTEDTYEIIAGERRWRAAQLAGLTTVPVVVKEISDEKTLVFALIENIQREDLSVLEEAQALERLAKEFDLTHQQIADAVGKPRVTVTHLLRLLTLPEEVKLLLEQKALEAGHAKVLLGLKAQEQVQVAHMIVEKGLSVRETERLVARMLETAPIPSHRSKSRRSQGSKDPDVLRLEKSLSDKLGAFVEIVHGEQGKGKGKITIKYNNLEELEGILAHIQ